MNARAGEFLDDVAVGSLRIEPVPWLDFTRMEGANGIDPRSTNHVVSIRYAVGTNSTARLRLRQPTDDRFVNVIVSPHLARARGVLPLDILGTQVVTRVVGIAERFPTLEGDFVLADQRTIATALNASDPGFPFYNEVWINDGDKERVESALSRPALRGMRVVRRSALRSAASLSPVIGGARDLLAVAAALAAALGIAGIVLAAASDVRARRWELLDLGAQGVDRRDLTRFVRLRLLLACAFAAAAAVASGIALAFATVRLVQVAADITRPNPPPLVTVQWRMIFGAATGITATVLVVVTTVVRRQLRKMEGARA